MAIEGAVYKVLFGKHVAEIETEVTYWMNRGYRPQGGVCVVPGSGYYQAMVIHQAPEINVTLVNAS